MKQKSLWVSCSFVLFFLAQSSYSDGHRALEKRPQRPPTHSKQAETGKADFTVSSILANLAQLVNEETALVEQFDDNMPEHVLALLEANLSDMLAVLNLIHGQPDLDENASKEVAALYSNVEQLIAHIKAGSDEEASKALRPNAPSPDASDAVVGKNTCDLTQVLALLVNIKKRLEILQQIICEKFAATWTILADIKDTLTEDIFSTQTVLCDKFNGTFTVLEALEEDISGVFTVLQEIDNDIFDTRTILCDKFNGTFTTLQNIEVDISGVFTALEDLDISVTIGELTVSVFVDLGGVFTVLEQICEKIEGTFTVLADLETTLTEDIFDTQTILCDKFNGTFTVLQGLGEDISGVFTVLADLATTLTEDIFDTQTILCDKFNGTFTVLQNIEVDISGVFTVLVDIEETLTEDIFDTQTILCDKFNGTFTVLQNIEVDISGVFTALADIKDTLTEDIFDTQTILCDKFNGTFTVLQNIEVDISGTFTVLADFETTVTEDIFDTQTILCDKFNGTFTVLQGLGEDISGVFTVLADLATTLTEDIFDTRTILCGKFNGTFTVLQGLGEDISGVFTVLADLATTLTEDIFDTQTILCDKFNGTFTVLQNIEVDISGTFTVLADLATTVTEDIFDTQTILCDKFNGTFTVLQGIEEDISGVFTALQDLEISLTVDFSEVFSVLNFICEKIEDDDDTILAALCSPMVITSTDVNITTFVISTSGFYVFGENIIFAPGSGIPAISIEADDVTIDMCGKVLEQGNSVSGAEGFRIVGGPSGTPRSNISIVNGTVRDFTRVGVSVGRNTATPADTACEGIAIKNLSVISCANRGIEFEGASGTARITNSKLLDSEIIGSVNSVSGDFALYIIFSEDIKVERCHISECGAATAVTAVHIESTNKCFCKDVSVTCCTGSTFIGFNLDTAVSCNLTDCAVTLNQSIGALSSYVLTGGLSVTGNNFNLCEVSNNTATDGPFIGFDLQTMVTRNVLFRCFVSNNLVTGTNATSHCIGFNYDEVRFCSTVECRALQNQATGDGGTNRCSGFEIGTSAGGATGTKNCEFISSSAEFNNGFNDERSFGFRPLSAAGGNTGNVYLRNLGMRNGPTIPTFDNQLVGNAGSGSNPGGIPFGSIRSITASSLNCEIEHSNIRII